LFLIHVLTTFVAQTSEFSPQVNSSRIAAMIKQCVSPGEHIAAGKLLYLVSVEQIRFVAGDASETQRMISSGHGKLAFVLAFFWQLS
jgi:hypothetical protein